MEKSNWDPRHKLSKTKMLKGHFKKRYHERVGVECNKETYKNMVYNIQHHKLFFIGKQSNRVSLWSTTIEGKDFIVAFDHSRQTPITILFKKMFDENIFNNDVYKEIDQCYL